WRADQTCLQARYAAPQARSPCRRSRPRGGISPCRARAASASRNRRSAPTSRSRTGRRARAGGRENRVVRGDAASGSGNRPFGCPGAAFLSADCGLGFVDHALRIAYELTQQVFYLLGGRDVDIEIHLLGIGLELAILHGIQERLS